MRTETIGLALYGLATGLVALLGWELYRARSHQAIDVPPRRELNPTWDRLVADGKQQRPDERTWDYSRRQEQWWQMIEQANWTGAEPKVEVVPDKPTVPDKPVRSPQKPLSEIISLKLVLAGGDDTRCQVQHKDPNVRVPEGEYENLNAPTMPGQPAMSPMGTAIVQVMVPGDTLWKPYDAIKFERVDATGPYAVFSRPSYEDPKKRIEEKLAVDELSMDAQSFVLSGEAGTGTANAGSGNATSAASQWRDPGEKTKRMGDAWMVSVKDREMLTNSYEDVFRESGLEDFVAQIPGAGGKPQRVRGVSIRRNSSQLARFGVKAGDVLIKVNGTNVTSKASAIRVGKDQYRRGVRRFELTFLSRGREVVRVYNAPNKK